MFNIFGRKSEISQITTNSAQIDVSETHNETLGFGDTGYRYRAVGCLETVQYFFVDRQTFLELLKLHYRINI